MLTCVPVTSYVGKKKKRLMNRTNTKGIYQVLVYLIAFAMVIIAALSKLNRRVGPANLEAMFFIMITRICLLILYTALIAKYDKANGASADGHGASINVFKKYRIFFLVSIAICAIGIGLGGKDYEDSTYDGEVYQIPGREDVNWTYPKVDSNYVPLSKMLTKNGQARLTMMWILVTIEIFMYYICDWLTNPHELLSLDADHLIERNELWAILIIGESIISLVTTKRPEVTSFQFMDVANTISADAVDGDGGSASRFYLSLLLSMTLVSLMIFLFMASLPIKHESEFPFDVHAFNVPGSQIRGFLYNTCNLFCSLGFFGMGTGLKFVAYFSDKPCMYEFDHAILLTGACGLSIVTLNLARLTHQPGHGYHQCGRLARPIIVFLEIASGIGIGMIGFLFDRGPQDVPKFKSTADYFMGLNLTTNINDGYSYPADKDGGYIKGDYSLYKFGNSVSDCFDKYGHKDPLTKGYGACYEKGYFSRFQEAADEESASAVHNCWKHYTHSGTTANGEYASVVVIKQYLDPDISPNGLLGILVGCVVFVIFLEFLLAPSARVMEVFKKDQGRRIEWNDAKKKMLRNLAKRYIPDAPESKAADELDPNISPAIRNWRRCVRLISETRNQNAGKMWADVLEECIGPKKRNRRMGEGDSVPFDYNDALKIPFQAFYVSMTAEELRETRKQLIEIDRILERKRETDVAEILQRELQRRPTDAEVTERMRLTGPQSKSASTTVAPTPTHELSGEHGQESKTDPVGWEQEEMRQRIVQLTADVLRRDAHIVRLLQRQNGNSSMNKGLWPLPQVTVEHL